MNKDVLVGEGATSLVSVYTNVNAEKIIKKKFDHAMPIENINHEIAIHKRLTNEFPQYVVNQLAFNNQSIYAEYLPIILNEFIKNPHDWTERFQVMQGIVAAVRALHAVNIIHGDIKLANIGQDNVGNVKLFDFGYTRDINRESHLQICGSPSYIAPEVYANILPYTKSAEIYSLSITLWKIARSEAELFSWDELEQYEIKNPPTYYDGYDCDKIMPMYETNKIRNAIDKVKPHPAYKWRDNLDIPEDCPPKLARLVTWGWSNYPKDRPTIEQMGDELNDIVREYHLR